jgi:D-lyxose ketol-isomerase
MNTLNRRNMMILAAGSTLALANTGAAQSTQASIKGAKHMAYKNADFYKSDGTFDVVKATNAYYEMMTYFHYPIVDRLKTEEFWALDFGMGKFMEVGMAGIFWINNKRDNYFGHEIYLLPGQMIPEHCHLKTDEAGPKMEAWQVRHGMIHIYAEGTPTPGVEDRIPPTHKECCVARTERKLEIGEMGQLEVPESKHWMIAGPEGAIVTEYATYHDNNGLRFSHPDVQFG